MKNQRGLITVDFLFAMVMIMGFSGLMFVLMFSMSMASVTQYVTFAAARNYAAGHLDPDSQVARANAKYTELLNNPVLATLYSNGWYSVDQEPTVGLHTDKIPELQEATQPGKLRLFEGVGTTFIARVLAFQIPFFGSTAPDGDDSGDGFKAYVASYTGREPTTAECVQFTFVRWQAIRNLAVSNGSPYSTNTEDRGYYPMTDDGC